MESVTATEPDNGPDADDDEQPARYVVRLTADEENPARFHVRQAALDYATAYELHDFAVQDSWAMGDVEPAWLARVEAAYAAREAETARLDVKAAELSAEDINARLASVGITPIAPATARNGVLSPALLATADPARQFYSVHASFDEDDGPVLLVGDFRREGHEDGFAGLRLSVAQLYSTWDVLHARRVGPKPKPVKPPQPSQDARAITAALGSLAAAVDNLTHAVDRGLSRL